MREFLIKQSDKQKCNAKLLKHLILIPTLSIITMACSSQETLTNQNTQMADAPPTALKACAAKPNCVSSQDSRADHQIEALVLPSYHDTAAANNPAESLKAQHAKQLLDFLNSQTSFVAIQSKGPYISAEAVTQVFRFVDDIEFLVTDNHIQVRSESRVGYYDFGMNRKRIEQLTVDWQNYLKQAQ